MPSGLYGSHYKIRIVNSTDANYNSYPSASTLIFAPRAQPGFKLNATNQCFKNNNFTFNNSTSGTGSFIYTWNFDDGSNATDISPIHSYSAPGKYNVSMIATNIGGCSDTTTQTVNVYSSIPSFSSNSKSQCYVGNSFSFTNNSTNNAGIGNLTYKWDFGDGNSTTTKDATYSYLASGTYNVKLYVTSNSMCTDSVAQSVTVYPKVFIGFKVNNGSQCINNQNFTFTNSSSVSSGSVTYKWIFGDGSAYATAPNPTYTYKAPGVYHVKLTATSDKGCFDTISKPVSVFDIPVAAVKVSGPSSICQGDKVVINANTGTNLTYQWLKDGVKIALSGTGATYNALNSGKYKVVVYNANGCSDTSVSQNVTVFSLPSQPSISKSGHSLTSSTATSYQWLMNGTIISGANSKNYFPTLSKGNYSVMITDSNGCANTSGVFSYDVSGIENLNPANQISIYPNPAHMMITIDMMQSTDRINQIQLMDLNGKVLQAKNIELNNTLIEIPVSSLAKGVYLVKLYSNQSTNIYKIMIE